MNDITLTLIRSVLKIGGGVLIAKGFADDSTVEIIVSGLVALIGVVWGIMHRKPSSQAPAAGKVAGLLLAAAAVSGGLVGCGSLDPAGVYHGDKLLYSAELATVTAYDTLYTFVTWEQKNRAALSRMPEIKRHADQVRRNSRTWINTAIALRDAYAANPSEENASALTKSLALLREAVSQAAQYMVTATGPQ